jgi:integrase
MAQNPRDSGNESILAAAKVEGLRDGENPARRREHLKYLLPSKRKIKPVKHYPALPWKEVPAFMAEFRQQQGLSARCLEFTILTAARVGEATGPRWEEIDLKAKVWTIPASRMKGGEERRVPLVGRALQILQAYGDAQRFGFVFPS